MLWLAQGSTVFSFQPSSVRIPLKCAMLILVLLSLLSSVKTMDAWEKYTAAELSGVTVNVQFFSVN